jgi:hypothetical protein
VTETTVKRLLCCGFRRTGKAMGHVYQCWRRICREINVFLFQVQISHVLRFISICDLFTDSPRMTSCFPLVILLLARMVACKMSFFSQCSTASRGSAK